MADYIGATPYANPILGLLAERLKKAQEFAAKPFGYSNPPAEMLMNLLGVPAVQQTAERLAYGEPLTTGRGMTTQIRPEAVEAALTVAPVAGLLGKGAETAAMAAGRAGERYAEKVVPQIMERGGLPAQLLGDLSQGSIRPMDVYHGTPYRFDKFDASKIGTGEGAQAYSYGLYFAESPDVAKSYANAVSDGVAARTFAPRSNAIQNSIDYFQAMLKGEVPRDIKNGVAVSDEYINSQISQLNNQLPAVYKVDLPDEAIANMLDWDKPVSKQPKQVQDALKNSNVAEIWKAQYGFDIEKNQPQMDMLYKAVAEQLGSPAAASQYFKDLGILGTRYLDEGSRAAGKGTSNFVVFPGGEDLLTIKEINDKPVGGLLGQSKAALTPVFETGKEVTFPFIKNTEKAPKMSGFGQDIEPAGNYILSGHDVDRSKLASGWTTGEISFKNPLVIDWGKSGLYTEPDNWKQVLSSQYGGKTGKALSKAIAKDGYDGIVTMTEYGPSEIVDLSMFPKKKQSLLD